MRAVIFAGPSLPPAARPDDARLDWRPPARQGDLYRAALERPDAIGLIDGYFDAVPSVWHKEILWAMAQGIPVCGAASIGALRAAELDAFGMIGIGRVYAWFRDGILSDDDEVALLHGPAETGYAPVSEAMVNIRATLAAATREQVISAETQSGLIGAAKAMFYRERGYDALLAVENIITADARRRLADWLRIGRVDAKRVDALALVARIWAFFLEPPARNGNYLFRETYAWSRAIGQT